MDAWWILTSTTSMVMSMKSWREWITILYPLYIFPSPLFPFCTREYMYNLGVCNNNKKMRRQCKQLYYHTQALSTIILWAFMLYRSWPLSTKRLKYTTRANSQIWNSWQIRKNIASYIEFVSSSSSMAAFVITWKVELHVCIWRLDMCSSTVVLAN